MVAQVQADLIAAMKAGDSLRVSVLRMLLSAFNYKKIDLQKDLSDNDELIVIQNEAKKRREAIESYTKGGRAEQAANEQKELEILAAYLPTQLTEDDIKRELVGMDLPKDFGGAMKLVSPVFRGRADGGLVARLVKEIINA